MIRKLLIVFGFLIALPASATHIVGGEFELIRLRQFTYRLNLIYYFDEKHGDKGNKAIDATIQVKIFQVSDGKTMALIDIPFISQSLVSYTQPECSNDSIKTSRQFYSTTITLSPNVYNHPDGYYVVWERCCRNYEIDNIINVDPGNNNDNPPDVAGQTFYLKFPPVMMNGVEFINSSPQLFPPLSDYACTGRPYFADFAGSDSDGDSLVYSLVTPFDTQDHNDHPIIQPAPYPWVRWLKGYDSLHAVGGSPDLRISRDGLLTCTPLKKGLYVFAVRVDEYRNNIKIGESRRDFQLFVVEGCQPDQAPVITGKKLTDASFSYVDNMSVTFANGVANSDRCIVVRVSDPDSQNPLQNNTEIISIRVVPLNFKGKDIKGILPTVTKDTLTNGSTRDFTICFPQCPFLNGAPYQIGIIAFDDACSLPLMDTLKVTVNQPMPPNTSAYFIQPQQIVKDSLYEGDFGTWPYAAQDDDGDNLVLTVITDGFALNDAGMTLNVNQQPGSANGSLDWSAICKKFEFSKKRDFTVKVLVDDQDLCKVVHFDTAIFHLKVLLPKIDPHLKIFNEVNAQEATSSTITMNLGHLGLNVIGNDTEPTIIDTLNLSLLGIEGTSKNGYSFSNATGLHQVESKFLWDFNCSIFKNDTDSVNLKINFLVQNNHCKTPIADTAFVNVIVKDIKSIDKDFIPANVITTYPDHCNDFFAIDGFESEPECNGQARNVGPAPIDNCSNRFERVKIYDRWGKQVFESNERFFKWYGLTESAGVYYYIISFSKKQYKSSLTVIH